MAKVVNGITIQEHPPHLDPAELQPKNDAMVMETRETGTETSLSQSKWTDNASAERFIDQNIRKFRYVYSWSKWLVWDGRRWSSKQGGNRVYEAGRQYAKSLWKRAERACAAEDPRVKQIVSFVESSNRKERIKAVIDLSTADNRVAIGHDDLDTDPYLFNCLNGTLDLRTMSFREHQQEDLITQVANVKHDPSAICPLWLETLRLVFAGDQGLIEYVQTLLGYSLSGITDEHILPICYGEGNNGKSTIWNAFHDILGDYSALVSQDLIMPKKDQHPTEIADMFAKRFVAVSEPEKGRKLAEARVKEWTGDRVLKARRMREDFWEFKPTHTLWLSTNHKPKICGTDSGIWRRLKLIPCLVDLSEVVEIDKAFPDKLKAEYSGILNWALDGWRNYQTNGLVEPQAVIAATAEYRASEDIIGQFIHETCIKNSTFCIGATECFKAFDAWGGKMTQKEFGTEMGKRYNAVKHTAGAYRMKRVYEGIGLIE